MYEAIVKPPIKRFPFGDAVPTNPTVLDPEKWLHVTPTTIIQITRRFPNVVSSDDVDKLIEEFLEYQHMHLDAKLLDKVENLLMCFGIQSVVS